MSSRNGNFSDRLCICLSFICICLLLGSSELKCKLADVRFCACRVHAGVNNAARRTVWIFISCVPVTVTHVPVTQSLWWVQFGKYYTHSSLKISCGVYCILPLHWDICAFLVFIHTMHSCVRTHIWVYINVVCLLEGWGCTDLFIASVPVSHHVSRIDCSLSPVCLWPPVDAFVAKLPNVLL